MRRAVAVLILGLAIVIAAVLTFVFANPRAGLLVLGTAAAVLVVTRLLASRSGSATAADP